MVTKGRARISLEPLASAVARLRKVPFDEVAMKVARALGISLGDSEENL